MLLFILLIRLAVASQTHQEMISASHGYLEIVSNYAIKTSLSKLLTSIKSPNHKSPNVLGYISQKFGNQQIRIKDSHIDKNFIFHVYGVFTINDIPVVNQPIALHFLDADIFSESYPLVSQKLIVQPPIAKIPVDLIKQMVLKKYDGYSITELKKVYLKIDKRIIYVYEVIIEDSPITKRIKLSIDSTTGEIYRIIVFKP
jgi:hypothetical protein